jgi:NadR type nicotinamide-nucleotide adenylyltransferase
MPFHIGHELMIDFASDLCEEVIVLVSGGDEIPIQDRYDWVNSTYTNRPRITPYQIDDFEVISEPQYDKHGTAINGWFWEEWSRKLNYHFPGVDSVFTNDAYGKRLAKEIDADWVPVDPQRDTHKVSGTMIRRNPNRNYKSLNEYAKEYYQRRIAIVGPESTGKSTLTMLLALIHNGKHIPEYGRTLSEIRNNKLNVADFFSIIAGQRRLVTSAGKHNQLLFVDTEAYTTLLFAELYLKDDPEYNIHVRTQMYESAWAEHFDLYILLAPTVPWKNDGTRIQPDQEERQQFFDDMLEYLRTAGRNYVIISDDNFADRDRKAGDAVNELLHKY